MRRIAILLFLILALTLALSGCSALTSEEQPVSVDWLLLESGSTLGQTFVADYDGLAGVNLQLSPQSPGNGEIVLHLRTDPQSPDDLAAASLPLQAVTDAGSYGFHFTPQGGSRRQYFYAIIEINGEGSVQVGGASGDSYLDGSLYRDGAPAEGQLSFELAYSRRLAGLGLAREAVNWGGSLALGVFLFILPGWGLLSLLWPGWARRAWGEKLGLSAGLSLAIYPLLMVWTNLVGLQLGALYAWLPPLAGLGSVVWKSVAGWKVGKLKVNHLQPFDRLRAGSSTLRQAQGRLFKFHHFLPEIVLGIVIALLFAARFWAARTLEAPLFGDSVQHTVMAQLMLDNGGLFDTWQPYAPYRTFSVQFGFSAYAALLGWLSGLSGLKAALIAGQLINGLAVLTIYPLATKLANGRRWAGVMAVLAAGLLSPMPAYYLNWGRYAQLAGQAILPAALWLVWETIDDREQETGDRKTLAIGGLLSAAALAGMMLAYYRMPFYYAAFILALLVGWGLPNFRLDWKRWLRAAGLLVAVGSAGIILFLPWGLRLVGGNLAYAVEAGVAAGSPLEGVLADYRAWRELFDYVPAWLAAISLAGIAWGVWRRQWMIAAQALWVALLSSVIAGSLIHLPGANLMQNFGVIIALYLPIGLVVGWMAGEIGSRLDNHPWQRALLALGLLTAAIWGAWSQRDIANPANFAILTRPDARALAWVRENTPEDASFLVEGFRVYGFSAVGSDGGWWLPLLTRRAGTIPPQYAILNEAPIEPDYTQRMVKLVELLETVTLNTPEGIRLLCDEGITHIYIGQKQGRAGFIATQLYSPEELLGTASFRLLYHEDRVYVFALTPEVCR